MNEGIGLSSDSSGFIPKNLENSCGYYGSGPKHTLLRAGSNYDGRPTKGMWEFHVNVYETSTYGYVGFRISREVM